MESIPGEVMTYRDTVPDRDAIFNLNEPHFQVTRDGIKIIFTDGQMHWLGFWDVIRWHFGLISPEVMQRDRRPNLTAWLLLRRGAVEESEALNQPG